MGKPLRTDLQLVPLEKPRNLLAFATLYTDVRETVEVERSTIVDGYCGAVPADEAKVGQRKAHLQTVEPVNRTILELVDTTKVKTETPSADAGTVGINTCYFIIVLAWNGLVLLVLGLELTAFHIDLALGLTFKNPLVVAVELALRHRR